MAISQNGILFLRSKFIFRAVGEALLHQYKFSVVSRNLLKEYAFKGKRLFFIS
jgi:hypothetical protein